MNIALFASGSGSNAEAIIKHFQDNDAHRVALVLTNNPKAGVLAVAERHGVQAAVITREMLYQSGEVMKLLEAHQIHFIALAGFLWWIPDHLITTFRRRIVNIHPSLLPKYGGKGMYGHHVHEAVRASGDRYSGLTIHYVSEEYDSGKVIVQVKCPVYPNDTAKDIGRRVLRYEHAVYPITIEELLESSV